jgi:TATA-box binding protein (TBP) (component of TFIID and TFIIIB)
LLSDGNDADSPGSDASEWPVFMPDGTRIAVKVHNIAVQVSVCRELPSSQLGTQDVAGNDGDDGGGGGGGSGVSYREDADDDDDDYWLDALPHAIGPRQEQKITALTPDILAVLGTSETASTSSALFEKLLNAEATWARRDQQRHQSLAGGQHRSETAVSLESIHSHLIQRGHGSLFNQKKLSACLVHLHAPFYCHISTFRKGKIECKGATSLLSAFLAMEWFVERLAQASGPSAREIYCAAPTITNIVARARLPFEFDACDLHYCFPEQTASSVEVINEVMRLPGETETEYVSIGVTTGSIITIMYARSEEKVREVVERVYEMAKFASVNRAPPEFRAVYAEHRTSPSTATTALSHLAW